MAAEPSFRTLQGCLADQGDIARLRNLLADVAYEEGMTFIDSSGRTKQELTTVDPKGVAHRGRTISMTVEADDGLALSVGELNTPDIQVAIGFTRGDDVGRALAFADHVGRKLEKDWTFVQVRGDEGPKPLTQCPRRRTTGLLS